MSGRGTPTGQTPGAQLVGTWSLFYYFSADGQTHASETIWAFESDGRAVKTLHTSNLTTGHFDTITRTARWRIVGGLLEIEYTDVEPAEVVRFEFELISGGALVLDGRLYQRVGL